MSREEEDLERRIAILEVQTGDIKFSLQTVLNNQKETQQELAAMRATRAEMKSELDEVRTQVAGLSRNREQGTVMD